MSVFTRLSNSIRRRDWAAALIDIAVVAVGILMALAIEDWRSERRAAAHELQLMKEARDEVLQLGLESRVDSWYERLSTLATVRSLLIGENPSRELSESECFTLVYSNQLQLASVHLPAVERLVSPGEIVSAKNAPVREAALEMLSSMRWLFNTQAQIASEMVNLVTRFPDLLPMKLVQEEKNYDVSEYDDGGIAIAPCVLQDMRSMPEFTNAVHNNYIGHLGAVTGFDDYVHTPLKELGRLLDVHLDAASN